MYKLDYSNQIQAYLDFIKKFEEENNCKICIEINQSNHGDWSMPDCSNSGILDDDPSFDEKYGKLCDKFANERIIFFDEQNIDPDVLVIVILKNEQYEQYVNTDT